MSYTFDQFDCQPCIYCDYSYKYDSLVQEMAIEIINRENANNGPDEQWLENEWYEFKDEAIEAVVARYKVKTVCVGCEHTYSPWDV